MVLDIIVAIIIIFAMVQGFRRGFIFTFIHTVGWLLAVILGFVWAPHVKLLLLEKTGLYPALEGRLADKFTEAMSNSQLSFDSMPAILSGKLEAFAGNVAGAMSENLADLLFTIISFLLVVFVIKLLLWLVLCLLSKKHNEGFTGFLDGALGLLSGFVKGLILVFVLLALLVPVMGMIGGDLTETTLKALDESYFAKDLYDNNLILLIVRDFLA